MNQSGSSGSERGSIQPRRAAGIGSLFDLMDPFRAFLPGFPGSLQQMIGIDVNRKDDGYEIEMSVPGFKPEDLDVTYQDGVLSVTGRNEKGRNFTRSFTVPEDIDDERIEAKVEHGMLVLTLHQIPKRAARKISITGATTPTTQTTVTTSTTPTSSTTPK
jgi:HSP20 family protein